MERAGVDVFGTHRGDVVLRAKRVGVKNSDELIAFAKENRGAIAAFASEHICPKGHNVDYRL